MIILVSGAAGFIGAKTAEILLQDGHQVIGIDNMNDYYDVRVKEHRLDAIGNKYSEFTFARIDIEDKEGLAQLFAKYPFDAVINLAARAGVRASIEDPQVYLSTNTVGTLNLLQEMNRHKIDRFVMASTSSLYAGSPMPFVETADVTRPLSPYAASKLGAEAMGYSWHHLYGMNVAIVRYFTVFGPAGRPDMSPFRFIEWISRGEPITLYGDGNQTRDFTYIDDIARGTVAALNVDGHEIINLGGGNAPISINRMIEVMEQELGKKAIIHHEPFHGADMTDTAADITKARRVLKWTPTVTPEQGFAETVAWHREHAAWLKSITL